MPLSLHRGSPVFMPHCFTCPQSEQGLGCSVCISMPFLQMEQVCLCAQQHPTYSARGLPACGYRSVLLALYSLQVREPLVCRDQWACKAAPLSPHWINHWVEGPLYARYGTLLMLLDLVPGEVAEDTYQCPAGWLGNQDGAPTGSLYSGEM